jgi:hypothetical protein
VKKFTLSVGKLLMLNILGNEDQDEAGNANNDDEPMDSSEDVSCSFTSVDKTFLLCSGGL